MRTVPPNRGATPIIANILLVGIALVIAVVLVTVSFGFLEETGAPTAEATFEYEQTPVGLRMIPEVIGTDVIVKLNNDEIATIEADSAGESILVPTAPGDTITVISRDRGRSVLVNKEIDSRSEIGDFIAYYRFDSGGGNVTDRSGNDNDGIRNGGTDWVTDDSGDALDFDGASGTHVDVGDLTLDGPDQVDEITVAIKYTHRGGSDIQNLIEHQNSNFAWFIETDDKHGDPHQMEWNVGYQTTPNGSTSTGDISAGETEILVGTYDGNEMVLYQDGTKVGSQTFDRDVALG
ncbi:LamG-like jellyroll fold domain-containing protein [Halovenus salina]|uniref:LamG-like jellyroll fold domain-containing protein n=1 Tax=Halovenus salina TaxID=1510225 RepID=UPI002260835C|nr:LamG-like jellyroll fold domain-containing protein [Halovenus salina]